MCGSSAVPKTRNQFNILRQIAKLTTSSLFPVRYARQTGPTDELYAILSDVKNGEVSEDEAIERLSRSPHGVWVAIDPLTKLWLSIDVGERTLTMAQCVLHQVVQVVAPDCVPLFLTDGFKA
jgi:hypothetical protein